MVPSHLVSLTAMNCKGEKKSPNIWYLKEKMAANLHAELQAVWLAARSANWCLSFVAALIDPPWHSPLCRTSLSAAPAPAWEITTNHAELCKELSGRMWRAETVGEAAQDQSNPNYQNFDLFLLWVCTCGVTGTDFQKEHRWWKRCTWRFVLKPLTVLFGVGEGRVVKWVIKQKLIVLCLLKYVKTSYVLHQLP